MLITMNRHFRAISFAVFPLWAASFVLAQVAELPTPAVAPIPVDKGWPRQYTDSTATLVLYTPQIESWPDFKHLSGRFATALTLKRGTQPVYGVMQVEADTVVDVGTRTVGLEGFRVTDVRYPSAKDEPEAQRWKALTTALLPKYPTTIALDRALAYLDEGGVKTRQAAVTLEPPPILVSRQPAVLVMIDGEPVLVDIEGTNLQKVVNTNWDLFLDKKTATYYLRNDKVWLSAKTFKDAWLPIAKLPTDFQKLPDTDQYKEIKQTAASPQKAATITLVLVAQKPTELIVVAGEPSLQPIDGTQLMWVVNTECDVFFDRANNTYYFLTSGRWFRAPELKSNIWEAATTSLPEDFKKIPADHPRAHVLASVPGTRQAEDAILAASIPQRATIERKSAKADVQYIGDPKFEPISGTEVSYAVNTPNDVLKIGDAYYLCLDGVWFTSAGAAGPWQPADKIPDQIQTIPPSSSKYNVTYVTVEESTPDTVTYSYTSGYTGVYIGFGVAMWGTGYYYPPYYGYGYYPYPVYWPPAYYTYGASVWYNPVTGGYARGSAVYGPYGGYARAAAYNPKTGGYAWGQKAWGPYGAAASGGFYNPNTGAWGGTYRASNGYQSWGTSVVGRGDQFARTASYSDSRGTVGGIQTSNGGKAIAARGSQGQGFAARSGAGDFYAGKDGNVYKRDQSGNWYRNSGSGSWESIDRQGAGAGQRNAGNASGVAANREAVQGLNRDAAARSWGDYNATRSAQARESGGGDRSWSSGGWVGNRSSGFSIRSGGFGRR
jgi:hypothetical protein